MIIQADTAGSQPVGILFLNPSHQSVYLGKQYHQPERLCNIIVRSIVVAVYNINFLVQCGKENQIDIAGFPYFPAERNTVTVRKGNITDNQRYFLFPEKFSCLGYSKGLKYLIAFPLKP